MWKAFCYALLAFNLGVLISCNPQSEAPSLLLQARQVMEEHPDSALRLIDSIRYPESSLNKEEYMRYLVARVQARNKNYQNVKEDTLIFEAERYFTQLDKDPLQIALAKFYSGWVRRDQGQYEPAMAYYKEADTYANKIRDTNLQGLIQYSIGDLFYEKGLHGQALDRYRNASACYRSNPEKLAYSLNAMGRVFLISGHTDSAFYYFHQALDIAENIGHDVLRGNLAQSLAVTYREVQKNDESEKYLRLAMQLSTDSTNYPRHYLNLAKLFHKTSQIDSARLYVAKLKESMHRQPNKNFQASAMNFLTKWERALGNYDTAFDYQERYATVLTEIMEDRMEQSVYEVEQKYNYEQMQVHYYQSQTIRQRWIIALLIIIIVGGFLFIWYWLKQRNKQIEIQHNIDVLTEMNRDLEEAVHKKQRDLRRDLLWRLDIANKLVKLNEEVDKQPKNTADKTSLVKRFNSIVYGEHTIDEQWEALLQIVKKARPGYVEQIRKKYPDLTESEFRVCILTYADFSVKEIAVILQQSPNTVQTRRTTLRQKLGLSGGSDIADHIDQILI